MVINAIYNMSSLRDVWKFEKFGIDKKREVSCQAGIRACSIIQNGDVYGCDLMIGIEEFKAGNIKDESLHSIWENSKTFIKLREINYNDLKGKCSLCKHEWCGGGCRSSAFNLGGSILSSDESCFYEVPSNE